MKRLGEASARTALSMVLAAAIVAVVLVAAPAGAQSVEPAPSASSQQEAPDEPTTQPAPTPPVEDDLGEAIEQDARHFGWPVVMAVLVALFLFLQSQVDRKEPKLADAPLDQGERLRFRS